MKNGVACSDTEDLSTNGTNARQSEITNDTPYHNPKEVSGPRIPEGDFCKQRPVESDLLEPWLFRAHLSGELLHATSFWHFR
jgi:hypothetical protein